VSNVNMVCPYCGKPVPAGVEPAQHACCGEVGHAVDYEQFRAEYEAWLDGMRQMAHEGRE
jgi:endogenous inhibitor of DNA gyrase (YacG/DUF329 family)